SSSRAGGTGGTANRRRMPFSRYVPRYVGSAVSASNASDSAIEIGTYRSTTRRPPSSLLGSRNAGRHPRITTNSVGNSTAKNRATGSRRNSFTSFQVILDKALMVVSSLASTSVLGDIAGQRDEGIIEVGLLYT